MNPCDSPHEKGCLDENLCESQHEQGDFISYLFHSVNINLTIISHQGKAAEGSGTEQIF